MKEFRLQTPASSANLGSGFDALGLAVNLYNRFYFTSHSGLKEFSFQFKNGDLVSKNYDYNLENNLLLKSYLYACKQKGFSVSFLKVECDNQIPDSSGLGSSTTAICAGIAAAFLVNGFQLNQDLKNKILRLAFHFEKHPDNLAPCLFGGFCIGAMNENKNDLCLATHSLNHSELKAFIILPKNQRTSTNESRSQLSKNVSLNDTIFNLSRSALLTSALISGNLKQLKVAMRDKIHQNKRLQQSGEINNFNQLQKKLESKNGFYGMSLSGSGPSLLILASPKLDKSEVEFVANSIYKIPLYLFDLNFDNRGLCLISSK